MAEMTNEPGMGGAGFDAGGVLRVAGAAVSLGLLVGMGVWGYKLVVRDANGVPIVRAMEGPMRETPSNPGGTLALNTGLAVNEVAAEGGASEPEDVLVLAPQGGGLTEEDLMVQPTAEADEMLPGEVTVSQSAETPVAEQTAVSLGDEATATEPGAEATGPMTADEILALADQISAGVAPLEALSGEDVVPPTLTVDGAEVASGVAEVIPASVPGVTTAYRPPARPAGLNISPAVADAADTIPATPAIDVSAIEAVVAEAQLEVAAAPVSPAIVGTTLVQLGAFDTSAEAQEEWSVLNARFADFMVGKDIVIQEATSGGRQFFRLRATGFADIADARRFCSALVAEEAACIPVVLQ